MVIDDAVVDPSVANSFATAILIQKQTMSMARTFEIIEYTMAARV